MRRLAAEPGAAHRVPADQPRSSGRGSDALEDHNLKRLLDAGLCVTRQLGRPGVFRRLFLENYVAAQKALGLTRADLTRLARNSITASLLNEDRKAELLAEIDEVAAGA